MSCADRRVTAGAVRSREQIQHSCNALAEYAMEHGTAEARRAFNQEEVWKHRDIYVFVDEVQPSGEDALTYVFPPDPSREGSVWGTSIDGFGTDYYFELHRLLSVVDSGWIHYAFTNPATGIWQPKSSYVMEIDWDGNRAAIGAGFYSTESAGHVRTGGRQRGKSRGRPARDGSAGVRALRGARRRSFGALRRPGFVNGSAVEPPLDLPVRD